MPRRPDPDLEERVLKTAQALWKRGGERALTMRAVARAAGTNTPALYRRFKNRDDLIKGLLQRFAGRIRQHLKQAETPEKMAEAYVEYAIKAPNEYSLLYKYAEFMSPRKGRGAPRPIRESRSNFAFAEQLLAKHFGGRPEQHTNTALILWALLHGTSMLLGSKSIPEGHQEAMREACRAGVRAVLAAAGKRKKHHSESGRAEPV